MPLEGMDTREVNARRQAEMAPFFEIPASERLDTAFQRLAEILHVP